VIDLDLSLSTAMHLCHVVVSTLTASIDTEDLGWISENLNLVI